MAFHKTRYSIAYGLVGVVLVVAVIFLALSGNKQNTQPATTATSTAQSVTATFACDAGKSIQATFDNSTTGTSTVSLALSDGRTMTLMQTMSADGARYSDGNPQVQGNEHFVFWNKGNTAMVLENNTDQTYTGCIVLAPDPGGLSSYYSSGSAGFSLRYPPGYSVDPKYEYQELGPGKTIYGVKFTIPSSVASGTNLAPDSYLSVETLPKVQTCSASAFFSGVTASDVTDGDTTYSVASSTGAGAGNRYSEWVYAIPGTNPCIAVRYFIHYGVIENYPPGSVQEFNEPGLLSQFDAMRRTLTIGQ